MATAPIGESPVSDIFVPDSAGLASEKCDQIALPHLQDLIELLQQPELSEPEDFRDKTFRLMTALASSPTAGPSGIDPDTGAQMRAAVDYLADHLFARKPQNDVDQKTLLDPGAQVFVELFFQFTTMIGFAVVRTSELPPSRGYEPLLIANGCDPIIARGLANTAIRFGKRQARESKRHRPVFDAIRFLAEPGRQKRAIFTRAEVLIAAWKETSIIETIFDRAGLHETEFIDLLEAILNTEDVDYRRLPEIAAEIAPHLSLSRGPKISAPSAALEFLLENGVSELIKGKRPSSWRSRSEEYCDALTEATRREFATSRFESRSVRRRSNAQPKRTKKSIANRQ
jgi:hypothetical protein